MSGDSVNIPLEKSTESKTELSSRRDFSPPPCVKKRRRFSEACETFVCQSNMASPNPNSPVVGLGGEVPSSSSVSSLGTSSSSLSPTAASSQGQIQQKNNFEPLDKTSSNTLKRNPKMELSKHDLLKLLGYLEGELQARDIVIAALKSEKLKHLLSSRLSSRYRDDTTDPHAALARDVAIGGIIRLENAQTDPQVATLEALVTQQRRMQCRMAKVLKEAEIRHRTVIKELEEEKRKHEHDTAQGDDITYGLEKERTRLKKELELERQEKKRLEAELKKESAASEMEKSRQKQIVLLLLAERKKIIMKYIEERKRSEDLAQILSEEKVRIDSMAEGLEEESKKSLQMEAELEKQQAQFDIERQQFRQALTKAEKRGKELEAEIEAMRTEIESWKSGAALRGTVRAPLGVIPPPPPAKPANLAAMPTLRPAGVAPQALKGPAVLGTGTPMVSSKVVQPTATVTSVPVSGPTTGIARSVTTRQAMRGVAFGSATPVTTATITTVTAGNMSMTTAAPVCTTAMAAASSPILNANVVASGEAPPVTDAQTTEKRSLTVAPSPPPAASPAGAAKPFASPVGTATTVTVVTKKPLVPRGIPPPVPPNKPVVPPKKEAAYMRRPAETGQEALKINKLQVTSSPGPPPAAVRNHQVFDETKPR